jgi:gliding motility-associated-like protein
VVTPVFYCQNSTAAPLSATGSNLLWYQDATGTGGSAIAPTPATGSTGTTFYYVSQTENGCESPRRAITVSVTASSTAVTGFSYNPGEVCMNSVNPAPAYDLGFTNGGQFTASPAGLNIDGATGIVNLATSAAGTYQVTYSFASAGCITGNSSSAPLTLLPAVSSVTVFSYNSPVCKDAGTASPNLANGFTLGGSFTSPPGLNIDNSTGIINISASTPGTYQVTYRLPEFGCRLGTNNFSFITINDTSSPVTGFTYNITDVCISTGINPVIGLQPGFTGGGLFSVTPGGLNIDASNGNINIGLSVPGIYTVRYALPASGCRFAGSDSLTFILRAFGNPVTGFSYFSPVCSGDDSATVVPEPGFNTGGIFSSTDGLVIHPGTGVIDLVSSLPGIYNITYLVDAGVCNPAGSGNSSIEVLELPEPPTAANAGICGPGNIVLQATALGTISWYNEPSLQNQVNVGNSLTTFISNSTSYFITNTVGTCESRPVEVLASVSDVPAPPVLGSDTSICPNDRIVLNPGNYNQYLWQDGSTASGYAVTQPGTYRVIVSTGPGCSDSAEIRISFLENCEDLLYPNAFAPNGRNRSFGALGNHSLVSRYALRIFNRYGEEVFASADPAARWDGTYKGKPVGSGAYVWVASYIYRNRIQKTQKGTVMVIR